MYSVEPNSRRCRQQNPNLQSNVLEREQKGTINAEMDLEINNKLIGVNL
jgi:hypothetical protein